jgi:hypothetical protein
VQGLLCIYVISHLTRYEVDNIMIQTQDGSKWIVGGEMPKMLQNYGQWAKKLITSALNE